MQRTKLMLVDDACMFVELLRNFFQQDTALSVVGLATSGKTALTLAAKTQPDLILLDIKMPGLCGLHLIDPFRERVDGVKIIMLSAFLDPFTAYRVRRSKVEGYVEKCCPLQELHGAVHRVREGGSYFSSGFVTLHERCFKSTHAFHKILTEREQHVLQLMATGLSDVEIADQFRLAIPTVATSRKRIRTKLALHSDRELLAYARYWGLDSKGPANTSCPLATPFGACAGH